MTSKIGKEYIFTASDGTEYGATERKLVSFAAARLDAAEIPHVLWGPVMMRVFGIPACVDGFEFVVEDDSVEAAYGDLQQAGFYPCTYEDCPFALSPPTGPVPHKHLHIVEAKGLFLSLWRKSDILWRLPNLSNVDGENIILASDLGHLREPIIPGRGGPFPKDLHPVRIPNMHRFFEASLSLATKHQDTFRFYYMEGAYHIMEYCLDNGNFDPKQLTGDFQMYYEALMEGNTKAKQEAYRRIGLEHTE